MTDSATIVPTSLPEFTISSNMRTAACTVAASFHAYQQSCFDLPQARKAGSIPANLQAQKERKQAYHLALKFLNTAALKENPAYDPSAHSALSIEQQNALKALLDRYMEQRLNLLIREEAAINPLIKNQTEYHPVIAGPW